MRTSRLLLAILLSLLVGIAAHAQVVHYYPITDSIERRPIVFDGDGRLWGVNFSNFTQGVRASGVSRFESGAWKRYGLAEGLSGDTLSGITLDKSRRVWVVGLRVVAYYDASSDRFISIPVMDSISSNRFYNDVCCDSEGHIWTSSYKYEFDHLNQGIPVYYASHPEVHRWDGHTWTSFNIHESDAEPAVTDGGFNVRFAVSPSGVIWFVGNQYTSPSTHGGLWSYDGSWHSHDLAGNRSPNWLPFASGIAADAEGKIWVSYNRGFWTGLNSYDPVEGKWIEDTSNVRIRYASTNNPLYRDTRGNLWFFGGMASESDPFPQFNQIGAGYEVDPISHTVIWQWRDSAGYPSSVAFDHDGSLWFSGSNRLIQISNFAGVRTTPSIEATMSLFPNPATNWVGVAGLVSPLTVTDAIGRRWDCAEREGRVDVSKLPAGVYFVHSGSRVARFVKE